MRAWFGVTVGSVGAVVGGVWAQLAPIHKTLAAEAGASNRNRRLMDIFLPPFEWHMGGRPAVVDWPPAAHHANLTGARRVSAAAASGRRSHRGSTGCRSRA